MRHVVSVLALVACAALTASAADEKYKSKDGKFGVQFPADAKVVTETKKAGDLDMQIATVTVGNEKVFVVMFMDLPAAAKDIPAKTLLDGGEAGGVKESGGKLESSKDIAFGKNKYPGREVVVDKDGNKIKSRIIVADLRIYVVIVGGPKDFATTKDGTKFLDSFEITK